MADPWERLVGRLFGKVAWAAAKNGEGVSVGKSGGTGQGSGKVLLGDLVRDVQEVDVLVGAERGGGMRRHGEDVKPAALKKTGVGALRAQGREGFEEARGRANVKMSRDR